jgi:monofunctional biosynthetic peptidoglycan transglycosylase
MIRKKNNASRSQKQAGMGSRILNFFTRIATYFLIISVGSVVIFKFVPIPITITMIDQKVDALLGEGSSELYYDWVPYDEMSKEIPIALVAAEDQKFPDHFGFDIGAIKKAFENNQKGKKLRGGSTISQQTAKNVFCWQSRGYVRKGLETYFTFLIEVIWGKKRILEVYANVAEMGKLTFGVEAASQKFYRKPAAKLSRKEAARLAAVLPSPKKWSAAKPGPYVSRRTSAIARGIRQLGGSAYLDGLRSF